MGVVGNIMLMVSLVMLIGSSTMAHSLRVYPTTVQLLPQHDCTSNETFITNVVYDLSKAIVSPPKIEKSMPFNIEPSDSGVTTVKLEYVDQISLQWSSRSLVSPISYIDAPVPFVSIIDRKVGHSSLQGTFEFGVVNTNPSPTKTATFNIPATIFTYGTAAIQVTKYEFSIPFTYYQTETYVNGTTVTHIKNDGIFHGISTHVCCCFNSYEIEYNKKTVALKQKLLANFPDNNLLELS